ncbi:MAG: winged helix-turn-helix domain-containing protein [Cellulosilyticaceae bacterium]
MNKKTILAVDDEEHILELYRYNLESSGYEVHTAINIKEMYRLLELYTFDSILLDIMLPDIDGITALRKLRDNKETKNIPIILVSAKSEEIDKVVGLELGADDYITKPFSVRELLARVHAVMRRSERIDKVEEVEQKLTYSGLVMNIEKHKVSYKDEKIDLTHKEFELLKILMSNKEKVYTRESLLDLVWGYDYYGESRTVDVHIRYLRSKLQKYGLENAIETVRGVGYRFAKE